MLQRLLHTISGGRMRNKLTFFFIVLATTPVLVLGGVTLYVLDISHRQDTANLEMRLVDQKIEEIQKFFLDTEGLLELKIARETWEIDLSQQTFLLDGLLTENSAFEEVSFINLQGKETSRRARAEDDGALQDLSLMPKFKAALKGDDYIGEVNQTLTGPRISLSAPVRNSYGDIVYVLAAEVNLSRLVHSMDSARLGSQGYLALFDDHGSLITRGARAQTVSRRDYSKSERVSRVLAGEILDGTQAQDRYQSIFSDGPVVGTGKKISTLGWVILTQWPIADADAVLADVRNKIIEITLIAILSVLLFAPLFANRLVNPIKRLQEDAARIEKGEFKGVVTIKTGDELEDLGLAFNNMSKGLERLAELKNEFVYIAAHELRTPVTIIKGYLSLIADGTGGPVPPKIAEMLEPVTQSNDQLVQLINDLLDIARSEAGHLEIAVAPVLLDRVITDAVTGLRAVASKKNITLSYKSQLDLSVLADTSKLKEIINNLLSNAIKYSPEGGTVTISHEVSGGMITTHVADTGFGIPADKQAHMFEKFYRVKTTVTRDIQGTGLGLFITKEIIEKMGGKIWFVSQEGKGTTFSFTLPQVINQKV